MTVEVKICGLKTEAALDAALAAGADYVGLVFCTKSPRNLDLATARQLAERARGRAKIVALLVDPDDKQLQDVVAAVAPDISSCTAARRLSASPRSQSASGGPS
jgi:phosphoribosylanthranilate isomerase